MTTEPDTFEPQPIEETWLFGGLRRLADGSYGHAWIEHSGRAAEALLYKAKGSYIEGSLYTVMASRQGERIRMHGKPRYHGRCEDEQLRAKVEAAHHAAKSHQMADRMERNDARNKAMDTAIEPVVDIARELRTQFDKDAFLAYVIRKIHTAW